MIVRINKNDRIIIIDTKKISHFEIKAGWDSGTPTLQAIKENKEALGICERATVEECLSEMNQIFKAEEIERESKVKDLMVSIKYNIERPVSKEPKQPEPKNSEQKK